MYKIIGADGKEYGPITAEQLRQWIAEGRANSQTKIRQEGATEWKPLMEYPDFATVAASTAPPTLPILPTTSPAAGLAQVNGPAIALIVLAILGFILQAGSLVMNMVGASIFANSQMPNQAWVNMFSGTVGVVLGIVGLLVSGLILFGGIKMKKLENYGLAMTTSILAMIPCVSPCCLIGLPIGIWAVVVLSKPEVKSAFH
jgi:hypothetical protein